MQDFFTIVLMGVLIGAIALGVLAAYLPVWLKAADKPVWIVGILMALVAAPVLLFGTCITLVSR